LHYFIDPFGSIPKPNADTIRRKSLLEASGTDRRMLSPDGTLYWTQWSKAEDACLEKVVEDVRNEQLKQLSTSGQDDNPETLESVLPDAETDFAQVASRFNNSSKPKPTSRRFDRQCILVERSAVECRNRYLYHLSSNINKSKAWTKEELMTIMEMARLHKNHPPWDQVALALNTNRTPWQCFQYYQSSLNTTTKGIKWSPLEDELLFKYIALQGPRFVVASENTAEICRTILPHRRPQEVADRALRTLLNPTFINEAWSEYDERRFVMLMKVYRDDPKPVKRLVSHFPYRSSNSIREKWTRSLNPKFSLRPWTKDEDKALLASVKKHRQKGGHWDWSTIASEIPNRRARTLHNRWVELVDEETLLQHQKDLLVAKKIKQTGLPTTRDPNELAIQTALVQEK
jgi:hypothetical protein